MNEVLAALAKAAQVAMDPKLMLTALEESVAPYVADTAWRKALATQAVALAKRARRAIDEGNAADAALYAMRALTAQQDLRERLAWQGWEEAGFPDVTEAEGEVLQALFERSPATADTLAGVAKGAVVAEGGFKTMLSNMVKRDLILSGGRGAKGGYTIAPKGRRYLYWKRAGKSPDF